ncbi:GntR family transcriptional regulator [Candidatus Poriferisocius sp.]|uniref:GntR family transcriptional regulator n=1 Tax=Candidatus Poriferisocius sp. TaxID=3101276 RepID=UPI003B01DC96
MTDLAVFPDPYQGTLPPSRRRGGLADEVVFYVREQILTGALKPGTKIDQEALAAALDVSRSPVREALVILGQEGLLDLIPRRGAVVADLTPEDIVDHYELFGVVAGRAAAIAADTLGEDEIEQLRAIHDRFVDGTNDDLSALNWAFHRIINRTAPRRTRWLLRLLERSVSADYYEFTDGWDAQAVQHHAAILEAIVDRNAEEARRRMEHHLHESGVAAVAHLERQGFWED